MGFLSDDEDDDEEESCSLPEEVVNEHIAKVDLNKIILDVLKLFGIEVAHVEDDGHLIMRKLEFVFLTLSPLESQKHLQMQVEALKEANGQMMEKVKSGTGKYPSIEVFPLNYKEKYNVWYGMPDEFVQILKLCLEKNGLKQSVCSST